MSNRIVNLILVFLLILGLGLIVYPSFSDYWNSYHQSRAIATYSEDVGKITKEKYDQILAEAAEWNQRLADGEIIEKKTLTDEELEEYNTVLDPLGTGMMGYIEIPSIQCFLSIYHGTSEAVLQIATGHLEWSSLPVGGENTHAVISAHRGLPSAKLFTSLDKLSVGDTFEIYILGQTYTYAVDQINIVEPYDFSMLSVMPGKDYVTLMTCTPYGINTHRLLVRGTRVENIMDNTLHFTSEAMQIDTVIVASILCVPILILMIIYIFASGGRSRARQSEKIKKEMLKQIRPDETPEAETEETTAGKAVKKKKKKRKSDDEDEFI